MYKTVTPSDAKTLIDSDDYAHVDVRSEGEYAAGHAVGAVNVPIALAGPAGMQPNPDFLRTMQANFAPDAKLVLACKAGGRSARACDLLAQNGYTNLVNMDGGFHGRVDPMGQMIQPGWAQSGLPTSTDTEEGASYAELSAKA